MEEMIMSLQNNLKLNNGQGFFNICIDCIFELRKTFIMYKPKLLSFSNRWIWNYLEVIYN